jgi:methyl-accepting chemotaxis protein
MRMTIGKKLTGSFLFLAALVFLAGLIGFIVVKSVSRSADRVTKEQVPLQNAVMNAALAVDRVKCSTNRYLKATTGLDTLAEKLNTHLDEFGMWIAVIRMGTDSDEFRQGQFGALYAKKGLQLKVQPGTKKIQLTADSILTNFDKLRLHSNALLTAHRKYVRYLIKIGDQNLTIPNFLNLAQREHLEWIKQLKDAVNIETTFTGETDPLKGTLGQWLHSFQVDNEKLMKLVAKLKKQQNKLMELAKKINAQPTYKAKSRLFNRGIGVTSKIEKYFQQLHTLSTEIYTKLNNEQNTSLSLVTDTAGVLNLELTGLIQEAGQEMQEALKQSKDVERRGITILALLTIGAVIVALLLGIFMSRYLSRNIQYIATASKKIARGDLQETIQIESRDELGELAEDTNAMIVNLREIIGKILNFSNQLTESARDLSGVSNDLDEHARDLNDKSTAASKATGTLDSSMIEVSTVANDSMENVQSVAMASQEMTSTITEIAENTEEARAVTSEAVTAVNTTIQKMNELGEAAKDIGQVAAVIVDIAKQTNLLALNATIEAARAGEAGKGFAVVANEVKELASQTNTATSNIRNKIEAIQQSSNTSIKEIHKIQDVMESVNAIVVNIAGAVEEQTVTSQDITGNITSVSSGIEKMTQNVDHATGITSMVTDDISLVNSTSANIQHGSTHIKKSSTELAALATELQKLVGQFRV